jgi:mannonate dehydratase
VVQKPGIRIALGQFHDLTEEKLRFAQQLGVTGVQLNTPNLPGEKHWAYEDLLQLRLKAEEYGLRFEAIENVPLHFYDKVMLGLDGRDEQIEHYIATLRNIGRAGIPILGYHFMPNSVWRTSATQAGRGGAKVTSFDQALVDRASPAERRAYAINGSRAIDGLFRQLGLTADDGDTAIATEEQMWANYAYFMRAVLPVAAEAGVQLALHPDDPPVPMLGGVARLFPTIAGFEHAEQIALDTPGGGAWGLDLCLGCCSEMPGGAANVEAMIDHFGPRGRISYVHFRDVQGTVPTFAECFIGEGNYDPAAMLLRLWSVGFAGFLLDDHVPQMIDDTSWQHRGRAHAIGYMQGLLAMAPARA